MKFDIYFLWHYSECCNFAFKHGLGVCAIAIEVEDAESAFHLIVSHGAMPVSPPINLGNKDGSSAILAEVHLLGAVHHQIIKLWWFIVILAQIRKCGQSLILPVVGFRDPMAWSRCEQRPQNSHCGFIPEELHWIPWIRRVHSWGRQKPTTILSILEAFWVFHGFMVRSEII